MLFSTSTFLIFFLAYFCLHSIVPARYRVYLIIGGSTLFYAWWRVGYTWLPYLLMAVAYLGARWMDGAATEAARKRRATAVIAVLFLPLLVVKYADFVTHDVIGPVLGWRGARLDLPLPLGISFVTFTLTAYLVEVYRRKFSAKTSASTVLAYVLFFPHLIAGPILRPDELIPQLERPRRAVFRRAVVPVAIFTMGLVKKLVFADPIAEAVDAIYRQTSLTAPAALLAIYGFSVQIYCDFSGYTDMAIGLALMLGVRLPNNFLRPYSANSIVEFWRRWHITLSSWLRDYLYVPLGGSRRGRVLEYRNIVITMALGGLWHGASWTFVIWGVFHGAGVAMAHAVHRLRDLSKTVPRWAGVLMTFHFVAIGWVFFRAASIGKATDMLTASVAGGGWAGASALSARYAFVLALMAVFFAVHRFDDHRRIRVVTRYVRPEVLWPVLIALWMIAITVSQGSSAKFIYFDF